MGRPHLPRSGSLFEASPHLPRRGCSAARQRPSCRRPLDHSRRRRIVAGTASGRRWPLAGLDDRKDADRGQRKRQRLLPRQAGTPTMAACEAAAVHDLDRLRQNRSCRSGCCCAVPGCGNSVTRNGGKEDRHAATRRLHRLAAVLSATTAQIAPAHAPAHVRHHSARGRRAPP